MKLLEKIHTLMYLPFFPTDKQLHFTWTFVLTTTMLNITGFAIATGAIISAIVLFKEYLDGKNNTRLEHIKDISFSLLGLISAYMIYEEFR